MRYDFSAQFLRIIPPDTTFGEAWESLCEMLLRKKLGAISIVRLRPPDSGVDILYRSKNKAFQCKSTERGTYGTIDAQASVQSLETAIKHKHTLEWIKYCFATNAEYTGAGYEKIMVRAKKAGIPSQDIEFLGPGYWDQLCTAFPDLIEDRFDYRVTANEKHFLEALQNITPKLSLKEPSSGGEKTESSIVITNNLNQVEIAVPMIDNIWVEAHIKAMIELLGLSEILNSDSQLGMALKPLFSLRFRGKELDFFVRLNDLNIQSGDKLELHIKLGLEALTAYDEIIQRYPNDLNAKMGRIEIIKSLGRLEEALASYDAIISEHPENAIAELGRAETLKEFGRLNDALEAYSAVIAAHPENVVAKIGYAEVLKAFGRFDDALDAYSAIIAEYPGDAIAKNGRAEVLIDMGRFDEALTVTDRDWELLSVESAESETREKRSERIDRQDTDDNKSEQEENHIETILQSIIWKAARRLRLSSELDSNNDSDNFNHYGLNSLRLVA